MYQTLKGTKSCINKLRHIGKVIRKENNMTKRRYGILYNNGKYEYKGIIWLQIPFHTIYKDLSEQYDKAYWEAFDYSCTLGENVRFGLREDWSSFVVWDTKNKENTIKEFIIQKKSKL